MIPIASIKEIYLYLRQQGNLRSFENDEMGILLELAEELKQECIEWCNYSEEDFK